MKRGQAIDLSKSKRVKREEMNHEAMARDVCSVLTFYNKRELSPLTVREMLNVACWWFSNSRGLGTKCGHWSRKAREAWERQSKSPSQKWSSLDVVHDHVIPRAALCSYLLGLDLNAPDAKAQVRSILDLSFICIISGDENKVLNTRGLRQKMPKNWNWQSDCLWARYKVAEIEPVSSQDAFFPERLNTPP